MTDGKQCKMFVGQIANPPPQTLEVHFVKLAEGSEVIDPNRIQSQVMISCMRQSALHTLHSYLTNVFKPVLFGQTQDAKDN